MHQYVQSVCPDCNGQGRVIRKICKSCLGKKIRMKTKSIEVPIPRGVYEGYNHIEPGESNEVLGLMAGDLIV